MEISTYKTWFGITLSHEYCESGICPVSLVPAKETMSFFEKSGMLFLHPKANKWLVVRNEAYSIEEWLDDDPVKLSFRLCPTEKTFYYFSSGLVENDSFSVKDPEIFNAWRIIEMDLESLIRKQPEEIRIEISSVDKYYEYILIPRYQKATPTIRLTEGRGKIRFKDMEKITLPEIPDAFRFVTKEKIKLKRGNDFKMQLWETKESGEYLISDCIPNPQPDHCSLMDPKNMITTYFYY